ncbi:hypothetical protein IFM89_011015 [Coptis chinensis]|uniref:PUL domain-containing protein n=1 Tax=Coptis chinensis TaxID=261450 RepID=A0A835ILZ9_9MAGN|nr:hypothetical protein IFM89_011015 [Coptis chinensis]
MGGVPKLIKCRGGGGGGGESRCMYRADPGLLVLHPLPSCCLHKCSVALQIAKVVDGPEDNMKSPFLDGVPYDYDGPTKPVFKHIPTFDGILKKIKEFNSALLSDAKDSALTEPEMSRLVAAVKILKDTSHYPISTFADVDIAVLLKLLISWPDAMIFPVIDVLRMTILHPNGASLLFKHFKDGNDIVMQTIRKVTTPPAVVANLLPTICAVTNLFKHSFFHEWLQMHRIEILKAFSSCSTSNTKVQVSYSTLVLNFAVLLIEKGDGEGQSQVLSAALEMLDGLMKKIAMDLDVQSVAKVAKTSKVAKIAEVGADIELLTREESLL